MATLTTQSKPSAASITNSTRVANGETWATWTTSWVNETRTWAELASFMTGTSKPIVVIDSYSETNQDGSSNLRSVSSAYKLAQTFTASTPFQITTAKWYLKKVGSPVGASYAKIYATSGGAPTGSALAISNAYIVSALSSSIFTLVTFTFSGINNLVLPAGTYAISFEPDDLVTGTNTLFGSDVSSPSHSGSAYIYNNVSWGVQTYDICFYVYGISSQMTNTAKPS